MKIVLEAFDMITEMANTLSSDVNELLTGYYLNNKQWFDPAAESAVNQRKTQIPEEEYALQDEKAQIMAKKFVEWAKANGYSGVVKKVWWTARPGSLGAAVGQKVDQKKNPTDILVLFTSGPAEGFLGLSAKATKKVSGDIGFKNPGLGTMESALGLDLKSIVQQHTRNFIVQNNLPSLSNDKLKAFIRSDPELKKKADEAGSVLLSVLRDRIYAKLYTLNPDSAKEHILKYWLDAEVTFPPYVKVTGNGNKLGSTSAKVTNPIDNPKMTAIMNNKIDFDSNGNESIMVWAGEEKIVRIRLKYDSQKMAGSIKLSGDPA